MAAPEITKLEQPDPKDEPGRQLTADQRALLDDDQQLLQLLR